MDICEQEELIKRIIQEANKSQTKEIQGLINGVKTEIRDLRHIIQQETEKRQEIEKKYNELQEKYNALEKNIRRNNILIYGLQFRSDKRLRNGNIKQNLLEFTLNEIKNHLGVEVHSSEINDIYTVGKQKQDPEANRSEPIIVKFCSILKKQEILRNCKKLKGKNIIISEDLNAEERKINKSLYVYLKEARKKKQQAYIRENKLYIDKKVYSLEDLKRQDQENEVETTDNLGGEGEEIVEDTEGEEQEKTNTQSEKEAENKKSATKPLKRKTKQNKRN